MYSVYCNGTLMGNGTWEDCMDYCAWKFATHVPGHYVMIDNSTGEVIYDSEIDNARIRANSES